MKETEKKQNAVDRAENKNSLDGVSEQRAAQIRQNSRYNEEDLPSPDNNLFWEHESNPLSSKGN
ncbi:MAG: hypothetical protein NC293_03210 [Roseburia sp.]|nr:hypothetical protein [Roseburia sp.]